MRPISYVGILSRLPEIEMKEINFSNARLRFNTLGFKNPPSAQHTARAQRWVSRADIHGYSILVHFGAADLFNKMGRCWAGAECCVYVYGFGQFFESRGKFRLRRDETIPSCAVAQFPSCVTTVRPLILMTRGGRGDRKAVNWAEIKLAPGETTSIRDSEVISEEIQIFVKLCATYDIIIYTQWPQYI